jgi:transcriptional antiterminator NusG
MKYYVVQVQTGSEEKFINLYKKRNQAGDFPLDQCTFYFPRKKMIIRRQGKQLNEETPLFPGYVFVELDETVKLPIFMDSMKKSAAFFRVLPSNKEARPLAGMELDTIARFLVKNGGAVGLSQVTFNENQRIVVVSGPMMGLEGNIVKVDKRKHRAKIKVDMFNTELTIDLGFEVLEADNTKKPEEK